MRRFDVTANRPSPCRLPTSEFPYGETAALFLLKIGNLGNVSTETIRPFGESELKAITAKLQSPVFG